MRKKKNDLPIFKEVEITDAGSEGKAVARIKNKIIFVPFVVPGDIIDIKVMWVHNHRKREAIALSKMSCKSYKQRFRRR